MPLIKVRPGLSVWQKYIFIKGQAGPLGFGKYAFAKGQA